jgi:Ca2+-transporting ATPase
MAENWHELETGEVFRALKSGEEGLAESEAKSRLSKFGPNILKEAKKRTRLDIFLSQFRSTLIIILIIATAFSALIGEYLDAAVIMVIVVLNAVFGFIQENKAEKAMEALRKLTSPEIVVVRGGKEMKIESRNLVPGDVVILEQGTKVPADMRLIEVSELKIDEAAITGESVPVEKNLKVVRTRNLGDRKCIAYTGTIVTYGRGKGMVVSTGMSTQMGRIAKMIQAAGEQQTPLQKKLDEFGKKLSVIILGICIFIVLAGIFRGYPLIDMILTGIALAVAAIPEGLPAVVTITLAIGIQRMSKRNAIIRKLPAVETLGCTTVICSDKTGTLTKNEMTIRKIWINRKTIEVTGEGYNKSGGFYIDKKEIQPAKTKDLSLMLKVAALCNNASFSGSENITGDPTEISLLVAAEKAGIGTEGLEDKFERMKEVPFTSERKMMTTLNRSGKASLVCVKGAAENVLEKCTKVLVANRAISLTRSMKKDILDQNHLMSSEALRVLGIAYKESGKTSRLESDLTFIGLMGMIDPPRASVKRDIQKCRNAGIKTVMITGDHMNTALAIAKELEMISDVSEQNAVTGEQLEAMSDKELDKVIDGVHVYARVNPEHKVRIVEALKRKGHVIAMTGDGVNDAPALKKADIGVSMGITGTDVAKEASDMVLRDDNFSTIVKAVESGRGIYDNIKKFIQYLLSSNFGEVLVIFIAMLIGFTDPATGAFVIPLTAVQLLWINLLTDGLPALALGVDPHAKDIMKRPPRDPKESMLSGKTLMDVFLVGVIISIGTLLLFWWNLPSGALKATTVAFTTIVLFEMVRVQSVRMNYNIGIFSNRKLLLAMGTSVLLQLLVIYMPFLQGAFETVPLDFYDWIEMLSVSSTVMIIMWAKSKIFNR